MESFDAATGPLLNKATMAWNLQSLTWIKKGLADSMVTENTLLSN